MPQLEYVNSHTLNCGCVFLIAHTEHRQRHPQTKQLEDIHGHVKNFRVVTQAEAEDVLDGKRAHADWKDHVHPKGVPQPEHKLCPAHASLHYGNSAYTKVQQDNAPV